MSIANFTTAVSLIQPIPGIPRLFNKHLQSPGDLGTKMRTAFKENLEAHQKVVIIGSDCASLSPEIVTTAFLELEHHDFVIGPAMDGGYYLLGMKQYFPQVFADIAWSTDQVCASTIERIQSIPASYFLLPELSDIDYAEDWEKYGWDLGE